MFQHQRLFYIRHLQWRDTADSQLFKNSFLWFRQMLKTTFTHSKSSDNFINFIDICYVKEPLFVCFEAGARLTRFE